MDSAIVPYLPLPNGRDYYAILGVDRDASLEDIRKAYYMCASLCHPDRESYDPSKLPIDNLAQAEYWLLVNEAYEVLSDPECRKTFDMIGEHGLKHCWVSPNGTPYRFSGDCSNIFEQFQAAYHGVPNGMREPEGATATPPPRIIPVTVTLEELFYGTAKTIYYSRSITAEGIRTEAMQTVSLAIVPGMVDGTRLVRRGLGDVINHSCGDAYFVLRQLPHRVFFAHGEHLTLILPLPLKTVLLGGAFTITCIDGKPVTLLFDQPYCLGVATTLPGEGMPIPYTNRRGDLKIYYLGK
uniref:J domain-containing protein n=1 Tax=Anopheles atroparvus TaxID=41427 RepID=A0AAG5D5Y2_ANOAO